MTGRKEEDAIVRSGPSQRSQCGQLTDSQDTKRHNNEIAMRVPTLTERFTLRIILAEEVGSPLRVDL
jgi:hypothetical protein